MRGKNGKTSLDALPDVGYEEDDILHAMHDGAEATVSWINDSILGRYDQPVRTRLDAATRKRIKIKAHYVYINYSTMVHRRVEEAANDLLATLDE